MATIGLVPSTVVASTAIRAPAPAALTRASNRQPPHARRLLDLGRRAPAMDALRVSGAAEPLLRPAAAGGHPRLRVRTRAQQGDGGAAAEGDAAFSWAPVVLPFLFPALGGLLFGYDIGATSGATISVQSPDLSGTDWFSLSSLQLGLVASGSLYGALGGSLLAYRIADFLGRRIELVTAAALYILGALVTGFAPNFVALIIGRVLYGIGIGLAMHGAPLYIAETSPSQIRGTLISLKELFIVLGILLGYLVGSLEIDNVGGWRAVQGKASLEDNKKKAIQALRTLRGRTASEKVLADDVDDTIVSIKAAYAGQEAEGNVWDVFEGASLKAFTIGGGLVLFQQVNRVFYIMLLQYFRLLDSQLHQMLPK
uniref:Major facilitator superfamily (MFS) profile domain-containing protein n=1 Tax=Zea mays TaxID=4577 RepID=A0A804P6H7_MAIZE